MRATDTRRWELDALRGLMLILMTTTHLPTRFASITGQPLGFVSAAEGFVFLSAYMAGLVYAAKGRRDGDTAMRQAFWARAVALYACQIALLGFAFVVIAGLAVAGRQPAVTDLLAFYLDQPLTAMLSAALLLYNPALLDILPIYIVFMLVSPLVIMHGRRGAWGWMLALSLALWLGAQFGLGPALYAAVNHLVTMPVRYPDMGAFEILAWQLLWMLGLWMGTTRNEPGHGPWRVPPWAVLAALSFALVCFVWRHAVGQTPLPGAPSLNALFDKWTLAPLRLLDFLALLLLAIHFGPRLTRGMPRPRALELLGRASLPVFCAHLVVSLVALALLGAASDQRSWWIDLGVLVVGLASLWITAWATRRLDRLRRRRTPGVPPAQPAAVKASGAQQ
ncbi:MAG: OpgC domain-containing protein [Hydrogenophaga sp.]|nr:OpgC domain-containing protein [Hydrogenophaga sp.]